MRLHSFVIVLILVVPTSVYGQTYVVKRGDSLSTIAQAHGVSMAEIARENGISDPDHVEIGQTLTIVTGEGRVVEKGVFHTVKRGVTLRRIANAYKIPLKRLVKINRIRNPDVLRKGMEIFIPGAEHVVPIATKKRPPCLNEPVEFYKVRSGESIKVVLTQCNGRIWKRGQEQISDFLDGTKNHDAPVLNARLLVNIQKVSNHFGNHRRIEVVSAFRPPVGDRAGSRHCQAKALDFRVSGIRNARLRDFARTLGNVGVGFYPNSSFVHLDVRSKRGFWVDWSGPGERPRYGRIDRDPADEVVASRRRNRAQRSLKARNARNARNARKNRRSKRRRSSKRSRVKGSIASKSHGAIPSDSVHSAP